MIYSFYANEFLAANLSMPEIELVMNFGAGIIIHTKLNL